MGGVALLLYFVYFALAFGLRMAYHRRVTGSSGFHGISGQPGSAEWTGGVLFLAALLFGALAALLDVLDVLAPLGILDGQFGRSASFGLYWGGLFSTLAAQFAMGKSWRIGVDENDRTELVTDGPFSVMRNPIFTAVIITSFALMLLVPNVLALIAFVGLVVSIEIQVRRVEEPYLLRTHDPEYARYAARVGRFIPLIGRLRSPNTATAK